VAEYEKFVRIHETGAMVDEAKTRIAKLKNTSAEEVESLLNMKKQDAPMSAPEAAVSSPSPAATPAPAASAAATPAAADPGGVKLTDPKEYLKQVLAKAKAAKNPQPAAPAAAAAPTAAPTPVAKAEEKKETPPPVAAAPAALEPEKPVAAPPVETPAPVSIAHVEEPAPVEAAAPSPAHVEHLEVHAAEIPVHFHGEEEAPSAIPEFSLDQPLPASALDGFVLDEQEVLEAITQVDTQSVEQESQVLEAVEAIRSSHIAEDDLLEDGPTSSPTSIPSFPTAPLQTPSSDNPSPSKVKHGFF